jgi:hypothetical protein
VTFFDSRDCDYMASTFTPAQLRHELRQAEIQAQLQEVFAGTPYDDCDRFPWRDYAECCRRALARPAVPPKSTSSEAGRIDTEAIKSRTDIVEVVGRYTKLRKSGQNRFTGKCPLHDDHDPSLTVYADKQTWHCFGACNKGGDIFTFIQAAENTDFRGAAAILGSK